MPYDVLMPQLGMAQDSAVIVSWLKAPGDAVVADDDGLRKKSNNNKCVLICFSLTRILFLDAKMR